MLLAKKQGGVEIGAYAWAKDGNTVEVPDEMAAELLGIKGGDFYVPEPEPEPETPAAPPAGQKAAAPAAKPAAPAEPDSK